MSASYIILVPSRTDDGQGYAAYTRVDSFIAAQRQRELAIGSTYGSCDPDDVLIVKEVDWKTTEVDHEC